MKSLRLDILGLLIFEFVPEALRAEVEESFLTPQRSSRDQPASFLAMRYQRVLDAMHAIAYGHIPWEVPANWGSRLCRAAAAGKTLAVPYTLLHGLCQKDCMTFTYTDGSIRAVTREEWQRVIAAHPSYEAIRGYDANALTEVLDHLKVARIDYTQARGDTTFASHGPEAAARLATIAGIPERVVKAIRLQGVASRFPRVGVSIALAKEYFGDLTEEEQDYVLFLSLCEQMASAGTTDKPDLAATIALLRSIDAYRLFLELEVCFKAEAPVLDQSKFQAAMAALCDAPNAFVEEQVFGAFTRIAADCAIT